MNVVGKAYLRTRILADYGALFYQVDLNIPVLFWLLDPQRIRAVAVQPIRLLNQDDTAVLLVFEEREHIAEFPPSWIFGRFDVHEFSDYC